MRRIFAYSCIIALSFFFAPRSTHACSPPPPATLVAPQAGDTVPANGSVLWACTGECDATSFSVTTSTGELVMGAFVAAWSVPHDSWQPVRMLWQPSQSLVVGQSYTVSSPFSGDPPLTFEVTDAVDVVAPSEVPALSAKAVVRVVEQTCCPAGDSFCGALCFPTLERQAMEVSLVPETPGDDFHFLFRDSLSASNESHVSTIDVLEPGIAVCAEAIAVSLISGDVFELGEFCTESFTDLTSSPTAATSPTDGIAFCAEPPTGLEAEFCEAKAQGCPADGDACDDFESLCPEYVKRPSNGCAVGASHPRRSTPLVTVSLAILGIGVLSRRRKSPGASSRAR